MLEQALLKVAFYGCMTVFGVFALVVNCINWLLCLLPETKAMEGFARRELHLLMRLWMWLVNSVGVIRVDWPEIAQLREMHKVVLVANHPNLLDICWILAASPKVTCIVKPGIRKNSFFNASARLAGYVSNDSGMDGLHRAVDSLRRGDILAVFPEGTRTVEPPMNPIKPGFALMARQAGAPVQVLYIHSNTKCFTKGVFFRCGRLPIRYSLRLGPRFVLDRDGPSTKAAREIENSMRYDLESQNPWK